MQILLATIPVRVLYIVVKHVICRWFLMAFLSPDFGRKVVIPAGSHSGIFSCS
jgi:hypothetical protein